MESNANTFAVLNAVNCNDHTEKKNGLTYLSWAWAWQIAKTHFPDAYYTIYENAEGLNYHHDGRTCWVKTGVTIQGLELIEYLPVMDYKNQSIPLAKVTSMDVNKAIQRSLTKALARHGLGLYIYAGEDMPDAADDAARKAVNAVIDSPADDQLNIALDELRRCRSRREVVSAHKTWSGIYGADEKYQAELEAACKRYPKQ